MDKAEKKAISKIYRMYDIAYNLYKNGTRTEYNTAVTQLNTAIEKHKKETGTYAAALLLRPL